MKDLLKIDRKNHTYEVLSNRHSRKSSIIKNDSDKYLIKDICDYYENQEVYDSAIKAIFKQIIHLEKSSLLGKYSYTKSEYMPKKINQRYRFLDIDDAHQCIYALVDNNNKQIYLGSSIDTRNRLSKHISELIGDKHSNYLLQETFNEDSDNLTIEILFDLNSLERNSMVINSIEELYIFLFNEFSNILNIEMKVFSRFNAIRKPILAYSKDGKLKKNITPSGRQK